MAFALGTPCRDDDFAGGPPFMSVLAAPYLAHSRPCQGFMDEIHSFRSVHGELVCEVGDRWPTRRIRCHAYRSVRCIVSVHQAAPNAAMAPAVRSASAA